MGLRAYSVIAIELRYFLVKFALLFLFRFSKDQTEIGMVVVGVAAVQTQVVVALG